MKICMITSYPPDRCGVSDYSSRLIKELKKRGHEVLVISRQEKGAGKEKNVERLIATKKVKRSFTQIFEEFKNIGRAAEDVRKSISIIKKFHPDVVHVQYEPGLYNLFFVPMIISKLKIIGIKSVITFHAIDYFPLNVFHRATIYGNARNIIVHTKAHHDLMQTGLPGHKPRKIQIIPMGLSPEKPGRDGKYVLFFGFLNRHKGVEELVKAFAKLGTKEKLVIIGSVNPIYRADAGYRNRLEKLIWLMGAGNKIKLIYDFIPSKNLKDYIRHSMFVVFPYTASYSGAQSQAIIDSLAFGKPLIVTKPAQGNLIDGENAIVVNPGDVDGLANAMRKLAGSKILRKKLADHNRRLARKLNWANIARITEEMYKTLLF